MPYVGSFVPTLNINFLLNDDFVVYIHIRAGVLLISIGSQISCLRSAFVVEVCLQNVIFDLRVWDLQNFFRCGVLKVAAPKLKVFPMSKCCCIHDDIYWRWPTLTTLKPFFKIDCGTQQLQKSIPSKLKMCIWKGLLESKVIWSLVAVSQGQKVGVESCSKKKNDRCYIDQ